METQTQIEPVLLHTDQANIDRVMLGLKNGQPLAEAVFSAYNVIPGLGPLTTFEWIEMFNNVPLFIQTATEQFYQDNYANAHETLGIGQEKGIGLVHDKLPDFSNLLANIEEYKTQLQQNGYETAGPHAFTIEDDSLAVNQTHVDRHIESCKLILTTETELKVKNAIDDLVKGLSALNEVIPPYAFRLTNGGYGEINLEQLKELITVKNGQFDSNPTISLNIDFFKKLKRVVSESKLP